MLGSNGKNKKKQKTFSDDLRNSKSLRNALKPEQSFKLFGFLVGGEKKHKFFCKFLQNVALRRHARKADSPKNLRKVEKQKTKYFFNRKSIGEKRKFLQNVKLSFFPKKTKKTICSSMRSNSARKFYDILLGSNGKNKKNKKRFRFICAIANP